MRNKCRGRERMGWGRAVKLLDDRGFVIRLLANRFLGFTDLQRLVYVSIFDPVYCTWADFMSFRDTI